MRKILISLKDHWYLLFKSAAHNHLRIQEIHRGSHGEVLCTFSFYSYTELKRYQKKVRVISFGLTTGLAVLLVGLVLIPAFFNPNGSRAAGGAPIVSSIAPTSGPAAGGTNVTISGSNFSVPDSYTKLLLHNDGSDTSIADSSSVPKSITSNGVSQSTAQSKFGGSSAFFNGGSSNLSIPNSSDWEFGSGDFTIDWWEYRTAINEYGAVIARDSGAMPPFLFGYSNSGTEGIYMTSNGSSWDIASMKSLGAITLNTWNHLAVVRSGNNFYAFRNGSIVSSWSSSLAIASNANPLVLGRFYSYASISGYIDELRVSKGIARWTSDFSSSLPTLPYFKPDVTIGGVQATNITTTNSSTITATTPAHSAGATDVTVTNDDGQSGTLTSGFTYNAAPTISSISPTNASRAGGDSITITGTGFYGNPTVTLGGTNATNVTVQNSTTITATTPAHNIGLVEVVVTNEDGQSATLSNGFTFNELPPVVSLITPTSGPTAGGTNVTISGENFLGSIDANTKLLLHADGSGNSFVDSESNPKTITANGSATQSTSQYKFGGSSAYFNNSTASYLSVPDSDDFYFDGDFTIDFNIRWNGAISGYESIMGQSQGGGTSPKWGIIHNFPSTNQITFDYVSGSSEYRMTWNWAPVGDTWYHFAIVRSGNNWYAFVNGVSLGAQVQSAPLMNISTPLRIGTDGEGWQALNGYLDEIRISKGIARWTSNFTPSTSSYGQPNVTFGGVQATNINATNSSTITAVTPANSAGATDVAVTNSDGQSGTLTSGFTYIAPPAIDSILPTNASRAGGDSITITGTGFYGNPTVTLGGTNATNVTVQNSTTITATTPAHNIGLVDVVVTNEDGQSVTYTNGFTYNELPPLITNISPVSGSKVGGTNITVTGNNFDGGIDLRTKLMLHGDGAGSSIVDSSITPKTLTVSGATQSTAKSKFGGSSILFASGQYVRAATSTDFEFTGDYTVDAWVYPTTTPSVSGEIVNYGTHTTGSPFWEIRMETNNTISLSLYNGSYLYSIASSSAISLNTWSHIAAVRSGNNIYLFINGLLGAGASTTYTGNYTPTGKTLMIGRHATNTNQYFPGYIDELRITKGAALWTNNFTVPSIPYMVPNLKLGGTQIANILTGNSTTITAISPAHTAGVVDVALTNYDGQSSTLTNGYTYIAAPSISSVTPNSGLKTGGDSITINGSNFYGNPTVTLGGTNATNVTVQNSTTITATTPAHTAGVVNVSVTNEDGQNATLSNGFTFNEFSPIVSSINPASGPTVGGTSVTISGSNFIPKNTGGSVGWATVSGKTLPGGLYGSQQVVVGDTIYLFGGSNGSVDLDVIYSASVSDPTTWINTGKTLPGALYGSQQVVVGDTIYLFGGSNGSAGTNVIYTASVSDPTTWTNTGKTLPGNLLYSQLAVVGDNMYLFGGRTGTAVTTTTNVIYTASISDPTTWSVVAGKILPGNLSLSQLAIIGNDLYLFGGFNSSSTTNVIYTASVSDPTTWTNTGKTLPAAISSSQIIVIGDYIYLLGGYNNTASVNTIYRASVSDPTTWTSVGTLSAALRGSSAAVIDDYVYLFGGYTTTVTNAIYRAPVSHFRSNVSNKPWLTNWETITQDQSSVTIGGNIATNINFADSTTITATTSAHAAGATDVVVTNYDGQSDTLENAFTYIAPPTVDSISPNNALKTGGDSITITGTGFYGNPTVTLGGTAATNVTVQNSTTITAITPAHNAGLFDVVVTNPDSQSAILTDGFTFNELAPNISSIAPTSGPIVGGTNVTISGTNFIPSNTGGDLGWATVVGKTLPANMYGGMQVIIDDYVYLFGGYNGSAHGNGIYRAPVSDPTTWTNTEKTLPINLSYASLAVIGDNIYLFGGYNGSSYLNTIYSAPVSDPTTWTNTNKTLPGSVRWSQVAIIGDGIYLFGGQNSAGATNIIYRASVSDPTTWTNTGKTLPGNLSHSQVAVIGTSVYLFGGNNGSHINVIYSASTSDPTTWTNTGKTLPSNLGVSQLAVIGDRIYLFGGWITAVTNVIYSALVSDPTTWTNTGNVLPASFYGAHVVVVDDYVYLYGGYNGSSYTKTIYRAPVSHFRPNVYNKSWITNWQTITQDQSNVTIGGNIATNINFADSTTITATTSAHAAGATDVVVTNYDGQSDTLENAFTYIAPPTITAVNPNELTNNQSASGIIISGQGFQDGATVKFKKVGESDIDCSNVVFNDSSSISCDADFHGVEPGAWDIEVTNADTQVGTGAELLNVIGEVTQVKFYTPVYTIKPDVASQAIRIQLQDSAGRAVKPQSDTIIDLDKTSTTGEFSLSGSSWSPITNITFTSSDDTKTVYYKDSTLGTYTISASENPSNNWTDASQNIVVNNSAPYVWPFDVSSDYQYDGAKINIINSDAVLTDLSSSGSTITNISSAALTYSSLTSFSEVLDSDNQGSVKYQLSNNDGTTWYWWNGSTWTSTTQGAAQANDATTINSHIASFNSAIGQIGNAKLSFRAYLIGDGTQKVTLDSIFVGYTLYPYKYSFISKPSSLNETEEGAFIVQAQDQLGNVIVVDHDTEISLATSTPSTGFFATDLSEDVSTRWDKTTVTIPAGLSSATFYYKDSNKGSKTISVNPPVGEASVPATYNLSVISKYRFLVTGISNPIKAGVPSSVTVQSVDYLGNPSTTYTGTIHFSSSDSGSTLPADNSLTSAMLGTRTYINGVTFMNQAEQCVTVTDVSDSNITGSQCGIAVTPPPAGVVSKLKIISAPQYVPLGDVSSAITVQLQDINGDAAVKDVPTTIYVYRTTSTGQFSANGSTGWTNGAFSVTVPAGATSTNFYYKDAVIGNYALTVSDDATEGTDLGLTNDSQSLSAVAGNPYSFSFNSSSEYITAGTTTGALNYSLHDSLGNQVTTANNQSVIVTVSDGEISLDGLTNWSNKITTTIPTGSFDGNFYYRNNTAGTYSLTISDSDPADGDTGLLDVNTDLTVHAANASGFVFLNSPLNVTLGDISSQLSIQLRDIYGNVAIANGDTDIYLYSDKTGTAFSVSASPFVSISHITIPDGDSVASFYFKQSINNGDITITASDNASSPDGGAGLIDASQTEIILQGAVADFVITTVSPLNIIAGEESSAIEVESRNSAGIKTPLSTDKTIYFYTTSDAATKEFSLNNSPDWNNVTSTTWPAGTDTLIFYYKDIKSGSKVITVSDDATVGQDNGISNDNLNIQINSSAATKLKMTNSPLTNEAGERGKLTVELEDQYGNAVNAASDIEVNLSVTGGNLTDQSGNIISNITINSGASSKDFYYQYDVAGVYNIGVSTEGLTSDNQDFTILAGLPVVADLVTSDSSITAGVVSGKIQAKLYNSHNVATVAPVDMAINITTNSANGKFDEGAAGEFSVNNLTLSIAAGSSLVEFYYKDTKAGTHNLYSNGSSLTEDSLAISIAAGAADHLKFISNSQTITRDNVSALVSGKIYDQYENEVALESDLILGLASSSATGQFSLSNSSWNSVSTLTIAGGQNNFGFYYKDSTVNVVQITASSSYGNITQTENIIEGPLKDTAPAKLLFQSAPKTLTINSPASFDFYLADSTDSYTVAPSQVTATVTSNSATGTFFDGNSWVSNLDIVFEAGESVKSFQYRDSESGNPTLTISSTGLTSATQQESVLNGNIEKIVLEASDNAHTVDIIPVTIKTMTNADLLVAVTSDKTISLTQNATGHFYSDVAGQNQISSTIIPNGSSSKVVYYHQTTVGNVTIAADETPSLGWTNGQKDIVITSVPSRLRFTTSTQTKQAGAVSDAMTVVLDDVYGNISNTSSDLVLHLSSSSTYGEFSASNANWTDADTITMASGTSSVSFYYRDTLAGTQNITISDVSNPAEDPDTGLINAEQNYAVTASEIFSLNILSGINNLEIGQVSSPIVVQAQDQYGNAKIVDSDFTFYPYSTSSTGKFSLSNSFQTSNLITNVKISAGISTATFYYQDLNIGNFQITVSDKNVLDNPDSGIVNDSQAVNVARGNVAKIVWETVPSSIEEGDNDGLFVVKTTNSSGIEISVDSDLTLYLTAKYATDGDGTFSSSSAGPWGISSVVVPLGSSRASFYYKDAVAGSPRIKVSDEQNPDDYSDPGLLNATTYVNIIKGAITKIVFETSQQSIVANHPSDIITVKTVNKSDLPTKVDGDKILYVRSSSSTGEFSQDGSNWGVNGIVIASGNDTGSFYYRDTTSGTYTLTVSDNLPLSPDTNWTNATQQTVVTPQQLDHFNVRNISDPQRQGTPSSLVVSPVDSENYVIKEYTGTITQIKAFNSNGEDEEAFLPELPYTFIPSIDKGIKTFTNSVAFFSEGEKAVVVTDSNGFTGSQQDITVVSASVNPIAQVKFMEASPLSVVKRTSTLITAELQDASGNPINATSASGYDLKINASDDNAELSIDGIHWDKEIVINVKQNLSFANFYYRNSSKTNDQLTVMDWDGSVDESTISNDTLDISVTAAEASYLQISGVSSQVAGTEQEITILAKDSDGDVAISYEGNKDIVFVGANTAITLQKPTCSDKFGNDIEFGNTTTLSFENGEAKCKLKLYRKEIAEIQADAESINSYGDSNGNLTIDVLAGAMDRNLSVLNAVPNPQQTGAPVSVIVLPKDAYGNVALESAFEVAFNVNGSNVVSNKIFTYDSIAGNYQSYYIPLNPGNDFITATLNGQDIKQDGEGESEGIVNEKIEGNSATSECNYILLNSDTAKNKLVYDICLGSDENVKSTRLSKSETEDTSVSQFGLETKSDIDSFTGKIEIQSAYNKFSGFNLSSEYLNAEKYASYIFLKISSDEDSDKIKQTTLRFIVSNQWLSDNSVANFFVMDDEGNNIFANKVDASGDNSVFEISVDKLPQYLALLGQKEQPAIEIGETVENKDKTEGGAENIITKYFEYPGITSEKKTTDENNNESGVITDAVAKIFGLDKDKAIEITNLLALISTGAAAASVGVATAASFPMLSYVLGTIRTASAVPYRRRQKWGVVYDSQSGQPLANALVVITDENGKVKEMKNTDQSGFYSFLAPQGTYIIDARKSGYSPAQHSHVVTFETYYDNSYICGEKIELKQEEIISLNIPMIKQQDTSWHKVLNPSTLTHVIFWTGFCFSLFALAVTPNYLNIAIVIFFIFNFLLNAFYQKHLQAGKILNKEMKPVGFATVKIFDKNDGRLLARTVANEKGSYALVMNEGEYIIEAQSGTTICRKEIILAERKEIREKIILELN